MLETLKKVQEKKEDMVKYMSKHLKVTDHTVKLDMLKDTEFSKCPEWKYSDLQLKVSKKGQLFIACSGFPDCKTTMSIPEGVDFAEKLEETCQKWEGKHKQKVNLFKLQFYEKFAEDDEVSAILKGKDHGTFWLMKNCDQSIKTLIKVCRKINYKEKTTYV